MVVSKKEMVEDERLAMFTDALLRGQGGGDADRPSLSDTVEVLARVLSPVDPPAVLRRQVQRAVREEWRRMERENRLQFFRWLFHPRRRWAVVSVTALLVVAVLAALFIPSGGEVVTGTAVGDGALWLLLPLLLLVGLLLLLLSRR